MPDDLRRAVLDNTMVQPSAVVVGRFAVLLVLSVLVAVVGLLQDSTAVVIGAMMIAPLMSPIIGIAACVVMGWGRRLVAGAALVSGSVLASVALSWAVAAIMPDAGVDLPAEVLVRSSPDVRDLLVALAAGGAGAYATVRRDVSGALPGVAVAVALVPPLASVGVLLGRDQPDLARGAALLFATNLFAIILAAAVTFVGTGFVPRGTFTERGRRISALLAVAALPTVVLAAILTVRFVHTADDAHRLRLATNVVVTWLRPDDDLNRVTLTGSTVQVNVTGRTPSPELTTLTDALTQTLGSATTVELRWTPVREPLTPAAPPPVTLSDVRPLVDHWLADQSLTLDGLSYDAATLVVTTSGPNPPAAGETLAQMLQDGLGVRPPVSLAWTRDDQGQAPSPDESGGTVRRITGDWVGAHPGTALLAVDQGDDTATVTLLADIRPAVDDLVSALQNAIPRVTIVIQWVSGTVVDRVTPRQVTADEGPASPGVSGPLLRWPSPPVSGTPALLRR